MSQTITELLQMIQHPLDRFTYRVNLTKLFCAIQASPETWVPHGLESSPDAEFMYAEALHETWAQLVQNIDQLTGPNLMPWFNQRLQASYRAATKITDSATFG
jgi:class 3 adenylate cyclase